LLAELFDLRIDLLCKQFVINEEESHLFLTQRFLVIVQELHYAR